MAKVLAEKKARQEAEQKAKEAEKQAMEAKAREEKEAAAKAKKEAEELAAKKRAEALAIAKAAQEKVRQAHIEAERAAEEHRQRTLEHQQAEEHLHAVKAEDGKRQAANDTSPSTTPAALQPVVNASSGSQIIVAVSSLNPSIPQETDAAAKDALNSIATQLQGSILSSGDAAEDKINADSNASGSIQWSLLPPPSEFASVAAINATAVQEQLPEMAGNTSAENSSDNTA